MEAQSDVEINWEVRRGQGDLVGAPLAISRSVILNLQRLFFFAFLSNTD